MAKTKTGISLDPEVLEQASAIAEELKVSRSRAISLAVQELSRRLRNRRMIEQINAVYVEGPDPEERGRLQAMKRLYRRARTV